MCISADGSLAARAVMQATWEVKAGRSQVQGLPGLQILAEDQLGQLRETLSQKLCGEMAQGEDHLSQRNGPVPGTPRVGFQGL